MKTFIAIVKDPTNNNQKSNCEVVDEDLESATIQANMLFGTFNVVEVNQKKVIGCTVEHRYAGGFTICDEEMLDDNDWVFVDEKAIQY